MQRKDNHIVKAQQGLNEKDKALTKQNNDWDLVIVYNGLIWDVTFKSAVLFVSS